MTVWKGTWKPDGTGGWHTKSDKDIVDQYNSARLSPAPAQMLKDAIDEIIRLREENERLKAALEDVLSDIAKSEHVNNLYPSPGKSRFWKSVVNAEKLLK